MAISFFVIIFIIKNEEHTPIIKATKILPSPKTINVLTWGIKNGKLKVCFNAVLNRILIAQPKTTPQAEPKTTRSEDSKITSLYK